MRWFKHIAGARNDPKLTQLFDLHGHRGTQIYWWVLEIIAEDMNESDRCEVTHTEISWAKMLRTYAKDLRKILSSCRDLQLIFTTSSCDLLTISCPKLLIIRARKKPIGHKTRTTDIDGRWKMEDKEPPTPNGGDEVEGVQEKPKPTPSLFEHYKAIRIAEGRWNPVDIPTKQEKPNADEDNF